MPHSIPSIDTFEATGAGRWFPAETARLRAQIMAALEAAVVPASVGLPVAALAPHAGYDYSGKVAGHTYRALRDGRRDQPPATVVILGSSHRFTFPGLALLDCLHFETPIGRSAIDRELLASLQQQAGDCVACDARPHVGEHAVENQIPFVQAVFPEARLLLGLFGDHRTATVERVAQVLADLARDRDFVVVASSDLLHDPDYAKVGATDRQTLAQVTALDWRGLLANWSPDHQPLCGVVAVATALAHATLRGCPNGTLLCYRNSGDDFPESRGEWVVGYGAVVCETE